MAQSELHPTHPYMGPLTITATNMTDTEVDHTIEDAKRGDQDFFTGLRTVRYLLLITQIRTH